MKLIQSLNFRDLLVIFIGFLVIFSCNKDSLVGSNLLDEDGVNVVFNDSTSIQTITVKGVDTILTNGVNKITQDLYLGEIYDSYFGFKKFESYFEVAIGSIAPGFYDYKNNAFAQIDSVVLIVNISKDLFYGDTLASHNIQAFQIDQDIDDDEELYTFNNLSVFPNPISSLQSIVPNLQDYTIVYQGDTATTNPSIRIKLNDDFGQMILNDTLAVKKDSSFRELIKGIKLTSSTSKTSVIPLDMSVKTLNDLGNKLIVYYHDTIPKLYSFVLGGVRHNEVQSDITGSTLEAAYNSEIIGESLLYLQGFGSADVEIKMPNVNYANYGDILVKKAELEVTIADIPGDEPLDQPSILFLFTKDDEGKRSIIDDIILAQNSSLLETGYGGSVVEELDGNGVLIRRYYNMNITRYFQSLVEKDSDESNTLYLGAAVPSLTPERSIFYGAESSVYPIKIKLTYSLIN